MLVIFIYVGIVLKGFFCNEALKLFIIILFNNKMLQDEKLNKLIAENGFRDGINGSLNMTIDNLDYYQVHKPKFESIQKIANDFQQSMQGFWVED